MEEECEVAYMLATEAYKNTIKEQFSGRDNSPVDSIELFAMFKRARDVGIQEFRVPSEVRSRHADYSKYVDRLQNYINQQEDTLIEINENIARVLVK